MLKSKLFTKLSRYIIWILSICCLGCFGVGIYIALYASPADYQQGEYVRIMYVHVPSAWMALGVYCFMGMSSFGYVVWRNIVFDIMAREAAHVGATFALITLITGSIWGQPIWGTWWIWDARLTSMLILFFFYIGYIALCGATANRAVRSDAPAILAIVGLINVPIVKFSVNIWATLHQPASILRMEGPSIDASMLLPLGLMFLGCISYFILLLIIKVRANIMKRKILRSVQTF